MNGGTVRPLHGHRPHRGRRQDADAAGGAAQAGRPPRHHVPRHQHDAQRDQRRHRRRRARRRVHARRRRQERHDQRPARRLVRRLHARAARRSSGSATTTTSRCRSAAAQAALPIWTEFMKAPWPAAPTCRSRCPTASPSSEIDRDTGKLAAPTAHARSPNRSSPAPSPPSPAPPRRRRPRRELFERLGELLACSAPGRCRWMQAGRAPSRPSRSTRHLPPYRRPPLPAHRTAWAYNSPVNQEVFTALAERARAARRWRSSPSSPRPAPRRSASAPRCSSTRTAARWARSAAAATRTTRSGRRARRSSRASRST